jgi:hypothetical protein
MVMAKLPKDLILAKIQTTHNEFDVTATGLVKLKKSKVPKDISEAMMASGNCASPLPPARAVAPENPREGATAKSPSREDHLPPLPKSRPPREALPIGKIPTEPGIYIYADERGGPTFVELEPTVYSVGKTGGSPGTALSYGIAKTTSTAVVRGAQTSIGTSGRTAEFYFGFEQRSARLSNSNAGFASLTSPNEFQLLRFDVKTNGREVVVGAMNAYSSQTGTDDKANVAYTSTKLRPGLYRVIPNGGLRSGEYAFLGAAATPVQGVGTAGAQRLFDFGVRPLP